MAYPVIETSSRVICFLLPTYAAAQTTAALDAAKFTAVNRNLPAEVENGWHLPTGSGAATAGLPLTDAQLRAAILSDVCAYAERVLDLMNPAWYIRALDIAADDDYETDANKQRWRRTWLRVLSAPACVQAAARAAWSLDRMRGLAAAQAGLMPLDAALLGAFFRGHDGPGWTTAFGAAKPARAVFSGNSDSRDTEPPLANSDTAAPLAWVGGADAKTISVTFDKAATPQNFNSV